MSPFWICDSLVINVSRGCVFFLNCSGLFSFFFNKMRLHFNTCYSAAIFSSDCYLHKNKHLTLQSAHNYISIFTLPMGSLFCCFPLCVSLVHLIENKIITILHVGFYLDLQVENQLIPLTEAHLFSQ